MTISKGGGALTKNRKARPANKSKTENKSQRKKIDVAKQEENITYKYNKKICFNVLITYCPEYKLGLINRYTRNIILLCEILEGVTVYFYTFFFLLYNR